MSSNNPTEITGGTHTGLELTEGDKKIGFNGIPTTEEEKAANRPPKNEDLPAVLRSEAFDGYD